MHFFHRERTTRGKALTILIALVLMIAARPEPAMGRSLTPAESSERAHIVAHEAYGNLPWHFEPNHGQWDPAVRFVARGDGFTAFVTGAELVLRISDPAAMANRERSDHEPDGQRSAVLRIQLIGANAAGRMDGQHQLPGRVNYYVGNDPARWRADLPIYAEVRHAGAYPGIDVVYHGAKGELEYDFVVAPGADPDVIRLRIVGAESLRHERGALVLNTAAGQVRLPPPKVFQPTSKSRRSIAASYAERGPFEVGFTIGPYDRAQPLIIDPLLLVYSTFLGGSLPVPFGNQDAALGMAVSKSAFAYVTGLTNSADLPVAGPQAQAFGGDVDAFVAKLMPAGSALVYCTYLGGSKSDHGNAIAINDAGVAFVGGRTVSSDFPILDAFQPTPASSIDAFLARLDPGGVLRSATYLGGDGADSITGVAVWTKAPPSQPAILGSIPLLAIVGQTTSADFPTRNPFQPARHGVQDSFVVLMNPAGPPASQLLYSTYLGGSGQDDNGKGIAVDSGGLLYVGGDTQSADFPTANAYQSVLAGNCDAFVTKIDPRAAPSAQLVYSTLLGGSLCEDGDGIAVDSAGTAYLCGSTSSMDFPTVDAWQPALGGGAYDGFVAVFEPSGANLKYATYLGGSHVDDAQAIAVDAGGNAYVAGQTRSIDFPTLAPLPGLGILAGDVDGFVSKLMANGQLAYSTYLGGLFPDSAYAVGIDGLGDVYAAGITSSNNFPIKNAVQPVKAARFDAFITRIREQGSDIVITVRPTDPVATRGDQVTSLFTVTNNGPAAAEVELAVKARGPEFLLADVSPGQGACEIRRSQRAFTCFLGAVYPGTRVEVQVVAQPLTGGPGSALVFTAQARLRGRELHRADNTVVQTIMLR